MVPCPAYSPPWWTWHPPVGVFIAVLGVLGVLVPWFRGEEGKLSRREKASWTLLMFVLVGLELRTLYLDRNEHDKEQEQARCEQLHSFQTISAGIKSAIERSQDQFKQTMLRSDRILRAEDESLKTFTGGDSFCFIHPVSNKGLDWFYVEQHGKYPIYGVHARIVNGDEFSKLSSEQKGGPDSPKWVTSIDIGDLAQGMLKRVTFPVPPGGVGNYGITFWSDRNGFWSEILKIRKVDRQWTFALRVVSKEKNMVINMKPIISPKFPENIDWDH